MNIVNPTQQPNFKWNRTTHLEMTMLALEKSNLNNKTKRQIARYSQMPDLTSKERGFHCNSHFFFPLKTKKSFGFGANNYNNALAMYKEHFQSAMLAKTEKELLKHIGYALHFLQDVSMPLHTESGGFLHKAFNFFKHRNFEKGKVYGATNNLKILKENYQPENIRHSSIVDLFYETAIFSQQPEFKVYNTNKSNWINIQKACFNKGTNATRIFVEKILNCKTNILNV